MKKTISIIVAIFICMTMVLSYEFNQSDIQNSDDVNSSQTYFFLGVSSNPINYLIYKNFEDGVGIDRWGGNTANCSIVITNSSCFDTKCLKMNFYRGLDNVSCYKNFSTTANNQKFTCEMEMKYTSTNARYFMLDHKSSYVGSFFSYYADSDLWYSYDGASYSSNIKTQLDQWGHYKIIGWVKSGDYIFNTTFRNSSGQYQYQYDSGSRDTTTNISRMEWITGAKVAKWVYIDDIKCYNGTSLPVSTSGSVNSTEQNFSTGFDSVRLDWKNNSVNNKKYYFKLYDYNKNLIMQINFSNKNDSIYLSHMHQNFSIGIVFNGSTTGNISDIELTLSRAPRGNITFVPNATVINVTNGTSINFNMTANQPVGSEPVSIFRWLLDGFEQAFVNVWTWIIGSSDIGTHTVYGYANDSNGTVGNKTYAVVVSEQNNPVVHSLTANETTKYRNMGNITIICNATDSLTPTASLIMTIQEKQGGIFTPWTTLVPYYNGSVWKAQLDLTLYSVGLMSIRCTSNDGTLDSNTITRTDYINILPDELSPGNVTGISPNNGNYDISTAMSCSRVNDPNGDIITYDMQYNVDSTGWIQLANNTFGIATLDLTEIDYGLPIKLRCRATDGIIYSNWYTIPDYITRERLFMFFMFDKRTLPIYTENKPYQIGVYANTRNQNITITAMSMDCNGDRISDYFKEYPSHTLNATEYFVCVNMPGTVPHIIDVYIHRDNIATDWSTVCQSVTENCTLERVYNLQVI